MTLLTALSRRGEDRIHDLLTLSLYSAYRHEKTTEELRALASRVLAFRSSAARFRFRGPVSPRICGASLLDRARGRGRGVVTASFHLGDYENVIGALAGVGWEVVVLLGRPAMTKRGREFEARAHESGTRVSFLDVEDPRSLLRAFRAARRGAAVVVYVDGNAGVADRSERRTGCRIMAMPASVRTGAAVLAQRADVPLLLALAHESDGQASVAFLRTWTPEAIEENGPEALTAELFAAFTAVLRKYPEQWEGWFYPTVFWPPATPPTCSRGSLQTRCREIAEALSQGSGWCSADPSAVQPFEYEASSWIVDGERGRVLRVTWLSCRLLELAFRRVPLRDLSRSLEVAPEVLGEELARLELSGLVSIHGRIGCPSATSVPSRGARPAGGDDRGAGQPSSSSAASRLRKASASPTSIRRRA